MLFLPLALLLQAVPPPFAQLAWTLVFGASAGPIAYVVPTPPAASPAEDCRCGVPDSPLGPR